MLIACTVCMMHRCCHSLGRRQGRNAEQCVPTQKLASFLGTNLRTEIGSDWDEILGSTANCGTDLETMKCAATLEYVMCYSGNFPDVAFYWTIFNTLVRVSDMRLNSRDICDCCSCRSCLELDRTNSVHRNRVSFHIMIRNKRLFRRCVFVDLAAVPAVMTLC